MHLLFGRAKLANVALAWAKQYPADVYPATTRHGAKREALEAMDPAEMTCDSVAAVIGNKSWTHYTCGECGGEFERVVSLGDDYSAANFCAACLRAASALASANVGG